MDDRGFEEFFNAMVSTHGQNLLMIFSLRSLFCQFYSKGYEEGYDDQAFEYHTLEEDIEG